MKFIYSPNTYSPFGLEDCGKRIHFYQNTGIENGTWKIALFDGDKCINVWTVTNETAAKIEVDLFTKGWAREWEQ